MYSPLLFYGYEQAYVSGFTVTALFSPQAVYREAAHRADTALHSGSTSWAKHVCSSFHSILKYRDPLMAVRACAMRVGDRHHFVAFKLPDDAAILASADKGSVGCRPVAIIVVLSEHDSLLLPFASIVLFLPAPGTFRAEQSFLEFAAAIPAEALFPILPPQTRLLFLFCLQ